MPDHPITPPPPELVEEWYNAIDNSSTPWRQQLATKAARWGADQELEACCEWVEREIGHGREWGAELRATRRPQPPSLVEEALTLLDDASTRLDAAHENTIRRALERLQGLEGAQ